jgi:ankyrin repeat protein
MLLYYIITTDDNEMIKHLNNRDINSINKLLKSGYNVNVPVNIFGHPTLFFFIKLITRSDAPIESKEYDIVKLIIDHKADVNYIKNGKNVLSLMCSIHNNKDSTIKIIQLLLDKKTDNNNPLLNRTALDCAINAKNTDVVRLLLNNKITINNATFDRYEHHFAFYNRDITKLLLEHMSPKILLRNIFQHGDILMDVCNLGCLNAFKQLFHKKINMDRRYTIVTFVDGCSWYRVTLLEIVLLNINAFNRICLSSDKDFNNYIEIAKILVLRTSELKSEHFLDYCVLRMKPFCVVKLDDTLRSIIKEITNPPLLTFFPMVLVNIINEYY